MHRKSKSRISSEKGSVLIYVIITLVILLIVGSMSSYISTQLRVTGKRKALEAAYQYASGGASLVAYDLEKAFKASPEEIEDRLIENGYTYEADIKAYQSYHDAGNRWDDHILQNLTYASVYGADGVGGWTEALYTRTIPTDILGVEIDAELWMPTDGTQEARIITKATVDGVTEQVTLNINLSYGFGGAIISTNPGSGDTNPEKKTAQKGNVVILVTNPNTTFVDGAILSNGTVAYSSPQFDPDTSQIQGNLYSTEDEIPNYTNPGSPDQLFNFDRFIAVADVMGTNYATTSDFKTALVVDADGVLEGVVVVNIEDGASDWTAATFPSGINIIGTLVLNFDPAFWGETDKLKILCTVNVNPADLSGLVVGDATTYTTGYPPAFSSPSYKASNVDITGAGFRNFKKADDLPAIMYNTAIADFHGSLNISGVIYSPVFAEIENKVDGQLQYISGSIIVGGGVYWENKKNAISIITYESTALDRLATKGTKGKVLTVARRD